MALASVLSTRNARFTLRKSTPTFSTGPIGRPCAGHWVVPEGAFLRDLQKAVEGEITVKNEEFFLQTGHGNLEFTLLAEGMRKLGLLWILVQNGTLQNGSVLFWDEPETNLNPKLCEVLIDILLQLQTIGRSNFDRHTRLRNPEGTGIANDSGRPGPLPCPVPRRVGWRFEMRVSQLPVSTPNTAPIDEAFSSLYEPRD